MEFHEWFRQATKTMENHSDIYSYGVEWGYDEPLWIHVVETDEASVLIGTGVEQSADEVTTIASDHDVGIVIVEHGDLDHYGGVPALRDAIDDLEVAVPAGDAEFLEEAGIDVDHQLEARKTYWGIETIPAPGHTPDNMAYLYEDVLIAGDTVLGVDSRFAVESDWSGSFAVSGSNVDDEQTRESVSNVTEYDFDAVLVSHGASVTDGGAAEIEKLISDFS